MRREEAEKYHGWTNYETWVVSLWNDNEESSYRYWREEARRHAKDSDDQSDAIRSLAEQLKEEISDNAPTEPPSVFSDLLNAALSEVNWVEIAENLLGEV
jgi:hypothetical protein